MSEDIEATLTKATEAIIHAFGGKTLTEHLRELAEARHFLGFLKAAEADREQTLALTEPYQLWQSAVAARREHEQAILAKEGLIRDAAVSAFVNTGDKSPVPGVVIKHFTKLAYAVDAVTNWARTNMPTLLALDKVRFEKAARAGILSPDAPVSVIDDPRAQISSDLTQYLDQPLTTE